ncbi:MAG: RdgB/HAM1 family non-canonical purine NTP pyrophosphatase [Rhodocyclaceae bacterium]|nr:RdgB/HAM1 family non-canonical purine NTP pyrophosphatase [Rhodocyclaceae bacterium]
MTKTIVLASNNPGKLREFKALFAPLDIQVHSQSEFDVPEAEEPHFTFVENALAKARHASRLTGLPALSDDSGLCVSALGGAPGVFSARFGGDNPKSDERNNEYLLEKLKDETDRRAHYVAVLVLVRHADDPQPIIAEGEWHGEILKEYRGSGGFGYDPLFWLPEQGMSAGELPAEVKNTMSHRAVAFKLLMEKIGAL